MAKSIKKGFNSTLEQYDSIMGELIKGKYHNLYLLYGDESFFIDKVCNYISNNALKEEDRSFNQFILYGSEITATDLSDICRQYPMGAERNVVIVKEAHLIKSFDGFINYAKSPLNSTIVVICYSGSVNKTLKFYKAMSKNGVCMESITPRDYEIQSWLINHIRSKGFSIDAISSNLLVESLGTSITKIDNELNKLINSIPEGRNVIKLDDIEQNIGISKEFNNFELTKALSEKNIYKAIQIVDFFGQNPQKNSFQATIIAIFNHFNKVFKLGLIVWDCQKKRVAQPNDQDLAYSLQIGSAFFIKEFRQALGNYPLKKLFVIFEIIREYEMKGKGVDTGSADSGALLKELIFKIITL